MYHLEKCLTFLYVQLKIRHKRLFKKTIISISINGPFNFIKAVGWP